MGTREKKKGICVGKSAFYPSQEVTVTGKVHSNIYHCIVSTETLCQALYCFPSPLLYRYED